MAGAGAPEMNLLPSRVSVNCWRDWPCDASAVTTMGQKINFCFFSVRLRVDQSTHGLD